VSFEFSSNLSAEIFLSSLGLAVFFSTYAFDTVAYFLVSVLGASTLVTFLVTVSFGLAATFVLVALS
jgi:hypothetical protein